MSRPGKLLNPLESPRSPRMATSVSYSALIFDLFCWCMLALRVIFLGSDEFVLSLLTAGPQWRPQWQQFFHVLRFSHRFARPRIHGHSFRDFFFWRRCCWGFFFLRRRSPVRTVVQELQCPSQCEFFVVVSIFVHFRFQSFLEIIWERG